MKAPELMVNKPLVILASARKHSDTRKLVNRLFLNREFVLVDLLDYEVSNYSYNNNYPASDEFLKLVTLMLLHEQIVFATPVYWYAMSGLMKTFFDRLTDIVTVQKPLGRRLAGKEIFLLAVGSDGALPDGFEEPFKLTSEYFEMKYKVCFYSSTEALNTGILHADAFMRLLKL